MQRIFKQVLFVVTLCIFALCGQQVSFGQIGFIPMPMPTAPPNPCIALQANINMASAGLNGWRGVLVERRTNLANAQARLAEVESWRELFWAGYNEQTATMSDGQIMAIGMINVAIINSTIHVAQMQIQVIQAEQQVNTWGTMLQNAQAAFTAGGC